MTVTQIRARDLTIGAVVSLPRYSERLTVTGIRVAPIVVAPDTVARLLVDFEQPRRLNGPFPTEATLALAPDDTVLVITERAPDASDADRIERAIAKIDHWVENLTGAQTVGARARIDDLRSVRAYLDGTEDRYIASLKTPKGA